MIVFSLQDHSIFYDSSFEWDTQSHSLASPSTSEHLCNLDEHHWFQSLVTGLPCGHEACNFSNKYKREQAAVSSNLSTC